MRGSRGLEPYVNRPYKSNRYVRKYGLRLLPGLYECFNPMPYEAARRMEMELADELQEKGYAVWQG